MAVHTELTQADFQHIMSHYALGNFLHAKGISDGIENSNYFITTSQGEFVLTIFEEIPSAELSPYLHFLHFLQEYDVRVAAPILTLDNTLFEELAEYAKPFIISPKLIGTHPSPANRAQCIAIAEELAKLHISGQQYQQAFTGIRSTQWLQQLLTDNTDKLTATEQSEFQELLEQYSALDLPESMTHGDLFTDNCIFNGDCLSGIIDFFNAGQGPMLFDLAVLINAWASNNGRLELDKATAIIQAYHAIRPLTAFEQAQLLLTLKVAALRFYLSRLNFPSTKKPEEFRLLLNQLNTLELKDLLR
ncbi:MAG: phosphotransferase [Sinobacterium sp.]|nr:phosphotransferase [Sinobacterium sp.]